MGEVCFLLQYCIASIITKLIIRIFESYINISTTNYYIMFTLSIVVFLHLIYPSSQYFISYNTKFAVLTIYFNLWIFLIKFFTLNFLFKNVVH
uniref:7TM_GPCR_Srx domain-containing protein n=1 Tax=Heterorhabditis bacteriophora TaxID=37862 RepID=A0A1I7WEU1_HETBA